MATDDRGRDDDERDESQAERLDRNWAELLQELRVTQTGSQILTGFLLTIPFQSTFDDLQDRQRIVYLILVVLAALATVLALAPVSMHRTLFRQRAKPEIVRSANLLLRITFVVLAFTLSGVALLVFDVVLGLVPAIVAAATMLTGAVVAWFAIPWFARIRRR